MREIILLPPRLDNTRVAVWGDSMAESLHDGLESAFLNFELNESSLDVFNFGIRAQNSVAVAMRHGGSEWTADLEPGSPSGVIPASAEDVISIGNFKDSILAKNQVTHNRLIESNGWSSFPSDPLAYGYWPNAFPSSSSFSPFKLTHVSIAGVEGVIWRDGPDWPFNSENYIFKRKESGKPVSIVNPVDIHVIGAGYDWSANNFLDAKSVMRSHNILWPFGPAMPGASDSGQCEFAADVERDSIQSMLDSLESIPGGSGEVILLYSTPLNKGIRGIDCIESEVYQSDYSDIYYDFVNDFKVGLPVLPPFKDWFSETYPDLFVHPEMGWEAPIERYRSLWGNFAVIPKASSARTVKIVGEPPASLSPGIYEQISTHRVDGGLSGSDPKVACKLGIEVAKDGSIESIWVHQGGVDYGVGDLLSIPSDSIGNADPLIFSVEETRDEVIGIVYDSKGNIDHSLSFSEFDQAHGFLPRSAFFDSVHLNSLGVEYLNHLLAYRLMRLSSDGPSIDFPDDLSDGDVVAFLSIDEIGYGGIIDYELVDEKDSNDEEIFLIEGNRLIVASSQAVASGSEFLVRIRASNSIGIAVENDVLLSVFDADLDVHPPFPLSASINGHELSVVFNEELLVDRPRLNRFAVQQGNRRIKVKSSALDQDQQTLHLVLKSSPSLEDGAITIGYRGFGRDQVRGVVEDVKGNDLASFSGFTVDHFVLDAGHDEVFPLLDDDGNGLVDGSEETGYRIRVDEWTAVSLYVGRGKGMAFLSHLSGDDWLIVAAQSTDLGFKVLVRDLVGQPAAFAEWEVESDGRVRANVRRIDWKNISQLSEQTDWESFLGNDLDGDGLIGPASVEDLDGNGLVDFSELSAYRIYNNDDPITLYSGSRRRQTFYNDDSSADWNIVAAAPGGKKGIQVLLEGEGQSIGEYAIWDVKPSGQISTKLRRTKWFDLDQMVADGYEQTFSYDINGDGTLA